jgi:hypothetical protein
LPGGEGAGDVTQADAPGALQGGEVEHVGHADPGGLLAGAVGGVDGAHALDGVQGAHLREHVAGQGDLSCARPACPPGTTTHPPCHERQGRSAVRKDQARLVRGDDGLGPVLARRLGEHVADVGPHRVLADDERRGDLRVRQAAAD